MTNHLVNAGRSVDLLLDRWRLHVTGDGDLVDGVVSVLAPPCRTMQPGPSAQWTVQVDPADEEALASALDALSEDRPLLAFRRGGPALTVVDSGAGMLRLVGRYRPGSPPALVEVDRGRRLTRVVVPTGGPGRRWPDWMALLFFSSRMLAHGWRMLHASAVQLGGVAVMFIAPRHGGKSTLAHRACVELGASFLGDDLVMVSPDGVIAGWPTRVAVPAELPAPAAGVPERQILGGVVRERVLLTPSEHRVAIPASAPVRLGALVQIASKAGPPVTVSGLELAEAEAVAAGATEVPAQRLYSTDLLCLTGGSPSGFVGAAAPTWESLLAGVPAVRVTVNHLSELPQAPVWEALTPLLRVIP